jgi:ATP-dependent helicase/nuclease subunit A
VDRLLQLTRQFDGFQREGLFRFLGFVEGQQDLDVEPATPAQGDSVRLMSIHQSKGLEFPIVVLADMGKSFNFSDTRGKIILDEELGLCPQIKAPQARQFYPSLPFWMAQQRQKRETLGEELRLLYVAVTRAVERLVLVGTVRSAGFVEGWQETAQRGCGVTELLEANSFLDWVGGWLCREHPAADFLHVGTGALISWRLESADELSEDQVAVPPPMTAAEPPVDEAVLTQLEQRLSWSYPHEAATRMAAKTSVSAWRREMADEEAAPWIDAPRKIEETPKSSSKLSAAERGSAHHAYLQHVSLDSIDSIASLKGESQRLVAAKLLTELQADCLDFETLLRFWKSPVGQRFLAKREFIRRELAFTAQFPPHAPAGVDMSGEFVVIQGVIDLCAILPDEIWLLDFKTDHGTPAVLEEKTRAYRPQLELYAQAIGRIHQKPVTQIWLHFLSTGWSREFGWGKEGGLLLKDETV